VSFDVEVSLSELDDDTVTSASSLAAMVSDAIDEGLVGALEDAGVTVGGLTVETTTASAGGDNGDDRRDDDDDENAGTKHLFSNASTSEGLLVGGIFVAALVCCVCTWRYGHKGKQQRSGGGGGGGGGSHQFELHNRSPARSSTIMRYGQFPNSEAAEEGQRIVGNPIWQHHDVDEDDELT